MAITIDELKRNVFPGESGGDYNALFGYANRPGGQFSGINLTNMTVDQALQFADPSGPYGQSVKGQIGRVATPMGAYQVVGTTLRGAKEGLGLTGNEVMTPELQDAIGMWIYQNQGPQAWEAWGKGGPSPQPSASTPFGPGTPAPIAPTAQFMPMQPTDPFEGMGLLSRFAASQGIAQEAGGAPLANLLNIITQKKDPRLADLAKQRGGFLGLLGA
jgi:hypothetical protein